MYRFIMEISNEYQYKWGYVQIATFNMLFKSKLTNS